MGSPLRILQIAYIPEDPVSNWLCNNTPNLITIIKDWVAAFGISRTIYLIYANYGITISEAALVKSKLVCKLPRSSNGS